MLSITVKSDSLAHLEKGIKDISLWVVVVIVLLLHLFFNDKLSFSRPEPHPRGAAQQPDSSLQEQDEEILGSDDEEQEDPNDYCKGTCPQLFKIFS